MVSEEYLQRCVRECFKDIIKKEGNRCSIHRRYYSLTVPESYLREGEHSRVIAGMKKLPRMRAAYNAYQDLLRRMESGWTIDLLREWLNDLPDYVQDEQADGENIKPLTEFGLLDDVLKTLEPASVLAERVEAHERSLMIKLHSLFGNGGGENA